MSATNNPFASSTNAFNSNNIHNIDNYDNTNSHHNNNQNNIHNTTTSKDQNNASFTKNDHFNSSSLFDG